MSKTEVPQSPGISATVSLLVIDFDISGNSTNKSY